MSTSEMSTIGRVKADYERLLAGTHTADRVENVLFKVYTTALSEGRGDLYVALGMARALDRLGWGVKLVGREDWGVTGAPLTTVCISMLESAGPGDEGSEDRVVRLAWARNWVSEWAAKPHFNMFDGVAASSQAAHDYLARRFIGPTVVLPIAADPDLFRDPGSPRDIPVATTVNYWGVERGIAAGMRGLPDSIKVYWYGMGVEELSALSPGISVIGPVSYFSVAEVYGRSKIVLDDLTPSAAEFGCQNSRLFESLAAGALVVTTCASGLSELGLSDVPVVAEPSQLGVSLASLLQDESRISEAVARLRATVLREHTFDRRAEALREFIERAREHQTLRREWEALWRGREAAVAERQQLRDELEMVRAELERYRSSRVLRFVRSLRRAVRGCH